MKLVDKVRAIIANTLTVPVERVFPTSQQSDFAAWDSLAHVNLMMSLEQEFGVFLDVEDFSRLISVLAIVEYLEQSDV